MKKEFSIYTDHFQFYLEDEKAQPDYAALWTDQAMADALAVGPGIIAVGTARFGGWTKVVVEVQDIRLPEEFDGWDQVAKCGMNMPSGSLVVSTPESGAYGETRMTVCPGAYRVMVFYGTQDSVVDDTGLEGDDHYRIVLWPGDPYEPGVLKRAPRPGKEP